MSDSPVKVVLDCSIQSGLAATVPQLLEQAAAAARAGDVDQTNELLALAQQRATEPVPVVETIVPLTKEELAQRAADDAETQRQADAIQVANDQQAALVAKLTAGKATDVELQQAVAQVLATQLPTAAAG